MDCPSLPPLPGVPGPSQRLGSGSIYRNDKLESGGASLAKKPHFDTRTESCQGGRKSSGGCVPMTQGRRGLWGITFLLCYSLRLNQHHLNLLYRLVHFQNFYISGEAALPMGLVLDMVKGYYLQLRCHHLLFHS